MDVFDQPQRRSCSMSRSKALFFIYSVFYSFLTGSIYKAINSESNFKRETSLDAECVMSKRIQELDHREENEKIFYIIASGWLVYGGRRYTATTSG